MIYTSAPMWLMMSIFASLSVLNASESGLLIDGFDGKPTQERVESVPGHTGSAIKLTFEDGYNKMVQVSNAKGSSDWDKAAGVSFWVKGDGSDNWGAVSFFHGDDDPPMAYFATFPLDNSEWHKVTLTWDELTPFIPKPDMRPIDPASKAPSKLGRISFGKLWFFRKYPAHSYAIDDMSLELHIERDPSDYTPKGNPLARVQALLKAGKPLTLVTMGDSLTDFKHAANRPINWPTLTIEAMKKIGGSEVKLVNVGVGGNQLVHGLINMPSWIRATPKPDLVSILYGYNDLDDGITPEQFEQWLTIAIDRVRRSTKGSADVVIITSCPAGAKWADPGLGALAEVCRKVAKAKNVGLADASTAIRAAGKDAAGLFFEDNVHLGPKAHALIAEAVMSAIASH